MSSTILDTPAAWVTGDGPDSDLVLYAQCSLARNFADFPYTEKCSPAEKQSIQDRILSLIESLNILPGGHFISFDEIEEHETQLFVERGIAPQSILQQQGPRGVYIGPEQTLNICINTGDHITLTGIASGLQLHEIWLQMNRLDDTLSRMLDFAFDERLGYLTHTLAQTGTALNAQAILHIPAITMNQSISAIGDSARRTRHDLHPLYTARETGAGDLYTITNTSTLGQSEDEILFNLKSQVTEILQHEKQARNDMMTNAPLHLEDRVSRALGLATHARILAFQEAITVWSSLRLGVANKLLDNISMSQLNELYIAMQPAHLNAKLGAETDEMTISAERAGLFRASLTP